MNQAININQNDIQHYLKEIKNVYDTLKLPEKSVKNP